MQSNFGTKLHVGIIMDGNGRWATRRGLSRLRGHEAGVEAIRRIVEAAPDQGIGTLTLYAFSTDNWRRPRAEVAALMRGRKPGQDRCPAHRDRAARSPARRDCGGDRTRGS
jgi:undecaprenyl diphosphate synthase